MKCASVLVFLLIQDVALAFPAVSPVLNQQATPGSDFGRALADAVNQLTGDATRGVQQSQSQLTDAVRGQQFTSQFQQAKQPTSQYQQASQSQSQLTEASREQGIFQQTSQAQPVFLGTEDDLSQEGWTTGRVPGGNIHTELNQLTQELAGSFGQELQEQTAPVVTTNSPSVFPFTERFLSTNVLPRTTIGLPPTQEFQFTTNTILPAVNARVSPFSSPQGMPVLDQQQRASPAALFFGQGAGVEGSVGGGRGGGMLYQLTDTVGNLANALNQLSARPNIAGYTGGPAN